MLDYSSDSNDLPDFYEPNDDTYILTEHLLSLEILKQKKLQNILEIGTGSGYVTREIRNKFPLHFYLQTDINQNILLSELLDSSSNIVFCDLFNGVRQELFDLVFFNPPYVVSKNIPHYEIAGLRSSFAGGENGLQIINQFIDTVKIKNVVLLCIEVNKPSEIVERFKERGYTFCEITLRRRIMREVIYIIEARK